MTKNNENGDVSIIVTLKNAQKIIIESIESILNQTHQNFELIVISIYEAMAYNLTIIAWGLSVYENRVHGDLYYASLPFRDIYTMKNTSLGVYGSRHKTCITKQEFPT